MGILIGFFLLLFFYLLGGRYVGKRITPLSFYFLWWGLICIAAEFRLRGERSGSLFTYFMIFSGAISFAVGYLYSQKNHIFLSSHKSVFVRLVKRQDTDRINRPIVYTLGFVTIGYLGIIMTRVLSFYKRGYTIGIIRQIYWSIGGGIINSPFEFFMSNVVVNMVVVLFICLFAIQLVNRKMDKIFLIQFLSIVVLHTVNAGGRMTLVDIVSTCVFAMIIKGKIIRISAKLKKRLIVIAAFLAAVVIYLTIQRQGAEDLITTIWSQYTMNIPFMSYLMENELVKSDITFGYVFFRGIFDLINILLGEIGIAPPAVNNILGKYTNPFFVMDGGIKVNAYTSHLFYFYVDGRLPGVVVLSILFGFFAGRIKKRYDMNPENGNLCRLLIIFNVIYYTFYQWKFVNPSYVLAMVFASWCFMKRKDSRK